MITSASCFGSEAVLSVTIPFVLRYGMTVLLVKGGHYAAPP
jgi:hypothetical protein